MTSLYTKYNQNRAFKVMSLISAELLSITQKWRKFIPLPEASVDSKGKRIPSR